MSHNLFVFLIRIIKTSYNTTNDDQIIICDNSNVITEHQKRSPSQIYKCDQTLEKTCSKIKSKTIKKEYKKTTKISWKKYLLIDNFQFKDDVNEMFDKYVSEKAQREINEINDIDELYETESMNSLIDIFDIDEIFNDKTQNDKSINVTCDKLSHSSDDFFYNLNLTDFNEILLSKEFITIFHIVEKDIYNIMKNSINFMYPENDVLKNILVKFDQVTNENKRISTYISICKLILNSEIQSNYLLEDNRVRLISKILHTSQQKNDKIFKIDTSLYNKFNKINLYLEKNEISDCDILKYIISLINQVTDENFKNICIFGLQNLFKKDLKFNKHRFIKIVVYLYIYINEKRYYFLDWHDNLIQLMSINLYNFELAVFTKNHLELCKKNNCHLYYHTYLAINTEVILAPLLCYEKLKVNKAQLQFVNELIDITNKVKCKIMGISDMNFQ